MILQILVLLITVLIYSETQAEKADNCESKPEVPVSLDSVIHFLQQLKNNYSRTYKTLSKEICTHPMDCEDLLRYGVKKSGVYTIWPRSRIARSPIYVYCDMETTGGGWTVFQRRGDFGKPKDFFIQDWNTYKAGFGDVDKDFWLGNDNIFGLSNQRDYSLRVDLQRVDGSTAYASYSTFWIDDEDHQYSIHFDNYSGNAGDNIVEGYSGQNFSTKDRQNFAEIPYESCAITHMAGWWNRNECYNSNLNGLYHKGKHDSSADGIHWGSFTGSYESLEWTEMKIRSREFTV